MGWLLENSGVARVAVLIILLTTMASSQGDRSSTDPFRQLVPGVELNDQDVIDGIAIVSHNTNLAVSVEFPLGATISSSAPSVRTFTANVQPGTVSEVLDRLCAFDPTFMWLRDGSTINVMPRSVVNDPKYFLNRRIGQLTFHSLPGAQEAVFETAEQLPGPREQIAIRQVGMSLNFARPWSTTFKDVTVREVFDQIARQFGPTYGWQFSGAQDFRMITFHEGIGPRPNRSNQKQSQNSVAK
jgi:hypothetical protein